MPIFEYLCPECNRVFSFLSKGTSDPRQPSCPKCGRKKLRKMLSKFAVTGATRKSQGESGQGGGEDPHEDPRVEREMMKLMSDAEGMDENDPRQLGRLMRRMTELTGDEIEPEMEEAMRRLEGGEDPEKIEEDMGDLLDGPGENGGMGGGAPSYDGGLYDL